MRVTPWPSTQFLCLGLLLAGTVRAQSSDALIVLTTVGWLTGAADACKVAAAESNALAAGLAVAVTKGKYGDETKAHILFNNARQRGVADGAARKVSCEKVADAIREQVRTAQEYR